MGSSNLKLSNKDVNKVIARWYITTEMSLNFERMQSIAYAYSLIPAFWNGNPFMDIYYKVI